MKKDQLIKRTAKALFKESGWVKVSIDQICQQAGVSRVTFYKYFTNKKVLVQTLFSEQKTEMHQGFLALLKETTLERIIDGIFAMQKQAMTELYSKSMVTDLMHCQDPELQEFFSEMAQEKYRFMHQFFSTLQQKKIIQPSLPIVLIDVLIQKIDEIIQSPQLLAHYAGNEQQMLKDVLQFFMYGIAYKESNNVI